MIQIQNVHKSFGDLAVLKGIDLDVEKGEIIGGSGSGKSTLLYCINAIEDIQQQRLAIARALAMKQDYMRFDEVTSALDPKLAVEVLDTLRLLRDDGMTMICVTHEIAFAREISDKVAFFHQGVLIWAGRSISRGIIR